MYAEGFNIQRSRYAMNPMKISAHWLLFEYKGRQLVGLSKQFKTKKEAEKARLKYPLQKGRRIGVGLVRTLASR
jgi:hypothetical protein